MNFECRPGFMLGQNALEDHRRARRASGSLAVGWATKIVAVTGGPVATLGDLKSRTLALGSRDSGHAAILPVYFLQREGLVEGKDYPTLRFNTDIGKHGDEASEAAAPEPKRRR
jgi:phosphonate transport system substrate-binding protein